MTTARFPATIVSAVLPAVLFSLAAASEAPADPLRPGEGNPAGTSHEQIPATPSQDDANLHDVLILGKREVWAVGDDGVAWHSRDSGRTWQRVPLPVTCPLYAVQFLTPQVGWIAGGGTTPATGNGYGVVLFTEDGGTTWERRDDGRLPRLYHIEFFGLEKGIAVGDASERYPTGVLLTNDGGRTWRPASGSERQQWRCADFAGPEIGVVAGPRGRVTTAGFGRVFPSKTPPLGLRGLHDVVVARDGSGWLVGDGGLVLTTHNGGLVWQSPPTPLPPQLATAIDFRAVAVHGSHVWLAGDPGSVIWHSPDAGHTWQRHFTGETAPIRSLRFASEKLGMAVGALGTILRSEDGGRTWQAVRGGQRRLAVWMLQPGVETIPLPAVAITGGEEGYRTGVTVAVRDDTADDRFRRAIDVRLPEAVRRAGGAVGEVAWQFPLEVAGLERNRPRLLRRWNEVTDGKLDQVLAGFLVRRLRTWRPDVVVLHEPDPTDAVSTVLLEAMQRAIRDAADATRFLEQFELAGLRPWRVQRVFLRVQETASADVLIDPGRFLPRQDVTAGLLADGALALLGPTDHTPHSPMAFRLLEGGESDTGTQVVAQGFCHGLQLAPGSSARRRLLPIDESRWEKRRRQLQRQRNILAVAERTFGDPLQAAQVLAQTDELVADLPSAEGARLLARLAQTHAEHSRWDLAEATWIELVRRYPDQPVALATMRKLITLWASEEMAWQRLRQRHTSTGELAVVVEPTVSRVRAATAAAFGETPSVAADDADEQPAVAETAPTLQFHSRSGSVVRLNTRERIDDRAAVVRRWQRQAVDLAQSLRRLSPAVFESPEVQLPLAAMMRRTGSFRPAEATYRSLLQHGDPRAAELAAAEIWLTRPVADPPRPVAVCRFTAERPHLDGLLSDACWQVAEEIRLKTDSAADLPASSFALLAYDREFLYVAATLSRHPRGPRAPVDPRGRSYDGDLADYDRIRFWIDTDRDYTTGYTLSVDQRGWTADRCWIDAGWNPKWYVAVDGDETRWRLEAAIPLSELTARPPSRHTVWAIGLERIIPAVATLKWPQAPDSGRNRQPVGLVRFE